METLKNPNVTKEQISDLLILNADAVQLNKQAALSKKKMETTSKVLKTHMKDLKSKGVKVENEDQINRITEEDEHMDINAKSVFLCSQAAIQQMKDSGRGGSVAGHVVSSRWRECSKRFCPHRPTVDR